MNTDDANPEKRYTVDRFRVVDEQMRNLMVRASSLGRAQELLEVFKQATANLASRPLDWGDPLFKTRKEGGLVLSRAIAPLAFFYAVFELEKVVMILQIRPMPGSGLSTEDDVAT